jgi:hypothetical protein
MEWKGCKRGGEERTLEVVIDPSREGVQLNVLPAHVALLAQEGADYLLGEVGRACVAVGEQTRERTNRPRVSRQLRKGATAKLRSLRPNTSQRDNNVDSNDALDFCPGG